MKSPFLIIVCLSLLIGSFVIQSSFKAKGQDSTTTPTTEEYQKAVEEEAVRAKLAIQVFEEQVDQHHRVKELLAKQEIQFARYVEAIDLQIKQMERYGKILDTWEKQQKQYQVFLDSLTKK